MKLGFPTTKPDIHRVGESHLASKDFDIIKQTGC